MHSPRRLTQIACTIIFCAAALKLSAQGTSGTAEYARAEALIRDHQWDAGLALLQPALNTSKADPKTLNLAGLAFAGKGEPKRAAECFESALKIDPDFVPALKNLAIEETALGEIGAAQKHLEAALSHAPDDPVANLYLGEIFYKQQSFAQAAEHFRRAEPMIQRDPNLVASLAVSEFRISQREQGLQTIEVLKPEALNQSSTVVLGVELARNDLCEQAIPYLLRAEAASPSSVDIRYDLAVCYLSTRKYPEAAGTLKTLIDEGHETSEIENDLAEAYEGDHKTQMAVDALRRAIAINPGDEDTYLDFASLCLNHQDFENAEKVISVGLSALPKSSRLVFERGILNAMQDHFESAEKDFQLSADLAPENDSGYIGLGVTYLETGNAAQAVPVLRKRLSEHPDEANLNYLLAEALLRSGAQPGDPAYTEAQTRLQKSIKLNPNLVEPHVSLGTIYLRQDKAQEAIHELEQARKIDPNSKAACAHLAVAYRKVGETAKAKEVLLDLRNINDRERTGAKDTVRTPGGSAVTNSPPAQ